MDVFKVNVSKIWSASGIIAGPYSVFIVLLLFTSHLWKRRKKIFYVCWWHDHLYNWQNPRLSISVCTALYNAKRKLYKWSCDNHLTPHRRKSEFIIFSRSNFVKPLGAIKFGNNCLIKARVFAINIFIA